MSAATPRPTWIWRILLGIFMFILKRRYRLQIRQKELLEKTGAKLVLLEHPSHIDPIIMGVMAAQVTDTVPVISEQFMRLPVFGHILRSWNAVAVSDLKLGKRDPQVLTKITSQMTKALDEGRTILLAPSGQIAHGPTERIKNKQSAYALVSQLPNQVRVLGVRIDGLWGSIWSYAWQDKRPHFLYTFLKAMGYFFANLVFFIPKRELHIEFVDITEEALEWATTDRWTFNQHLEKFYNTHGPDELKYVKHFFFLPGQKK
ncbi:MAG: lysophospholipid acyltransferase family protein [Bacteroidota bacterium]